MATASAQPLALVTGGHHRLGGVIAAHLADAGYALALHGSHDVVLDAELSTALARNGTHSHSFVADFTDGEAPPRLMRDIVARFGRPPDLLVNNASIFGQDRLDDVTAADLHNHYAVNTVAPVLLTRALVAEREAQGLRSSACIVNILDQRLAHPHGDQLSYTLGKQALAGFTQLAARELAARAIRVNGVAPGLTIATKDYSAEQMERLALMMPLHDLPRPRQIAEAVLYLARAEAVTGQVIAVDCGAHMQSYARDFLHL